MWIFKNYKNLTQQEHITLLNIRNEKKIRESSKNKEIITLNNHLKWVELLNKEKSYFALFIDEKIVGGLNFTKKLNSIKEWGVFFSKDTKPLISSIATYIFINYMFEKADILYSQVSKENNQALRFNEYFKIEIYNEEEEFYNLILTKEKWQKEQNNFKFLQNRVKKINYKFR